MVVVIISRINWSVKTVRNVTSITLVSHVYTVTGDTTETVSDADYFVRIMN